MIEGKKEREARKNARINKKIAKQEAKIVKNTPTAKNRVTAKSKSMGFGLSNPSTVSKTKKIASCGSAAQLKGSNSCSKSAKGKAFSNSSSSNLNINNNAFNKRKKAEKRVSKLTSKLKTTAKPHKNGKHANPRFL